MTKRFVAGVFCVLARGVWAFDLARWASTSWFFQNPMARSFVRPGSVVIYPSPGIVFGPLDDAVMGRSASPSITTTLGGSSQSNWLEADGTAVWSGTMVEANGGFCGARCRVLEPPLDASGYRGVRVRVRSEEALRFKFIVRDATDWNGVAWTWIFDASGDTEVELPFADATPTRFARTLPGARPLDTSTLTTVQFVFSKFEFDDGLNPTFREGPFSLEIRKVELY